MSEEKCLTLTSRHVSVTSSRYDEVAAVGIIYIFSNTAVRLADTEALVIAVSALRTLLRRRR